MTRVLVINGPNLNLLGRREPEIYGSLSFTEFFESLRSKFEDVELHYFQSNVEGEIIDKIQESASGFDGIILNAAAYTHTSVGIGDAVSAIDVPVVEVHISNTFSREKFRHSSYIAPNARGIIVGFGLKSYELAILSLI